MKIVALTVDSQSSPEPDTRGNFGSFVPHSYKEAVVEAGGFPVILPFPDDTALVENFARRAVGVFDALLVPGGADIDPSFYGEAPVPELGAVSIKRDIYEIALIRETVKAGKPIFGICRGLEIINVALGGTLWQDLPSQNKAAFVKHRQEEADGLPSHHISVAPGSRLAGILGETAFVNSHHHQAIKDLAPGLRVAARAEDGIIEAFEDDARKILAVQWHPEIIRRDFPAQLRLFADFVARC